MSALLAPESAIGVFDSGVGGLSVLQAIRRECPHENLVYIADSKNAPYGDKPAEFIAGRVEELSRALLSMGVKAIALACNTATAVAVTNLRSWCPVPVVAMEPAIKPATQSSKTGIIGVLATSRTLASTNVERLCKTYGASTRILLQACPGLVEQVENGDLDGPATRELLERYITPLISQGADILVLGCTHYPFLHSCIREIAGEKASILDSAQPVARELARRLQANKTARTEGVQCSQLFFTSASTQQAGSIISRLWGSDVVVHSLDEILPARMNQKTGIST